MLAKFVVSALTLASVSAVEIDIASDKCTSMIFGRKATKHGFPVATHANDCADCDNRMAAVMAKDFPAGSERPVYDGMWMGYPRVVQTDRADIYEPTTSNALSTPLGHIPQVNHTNALWESSYPLINEFGLGYGESTSSAKKVLALAEINHLDPRTNTTNGTALFTIAPLMTIAAERCETARCAISVMGALGQQYGFTGEAYATSEVVTVIDKTDAWVFEMTGDGKTGALWVAQRLPEDHVSVIANTVTIKEIDQNDKENFMFSDNLFNVTKALGLWNGKFPFNWQKTVSEPLSLQRYASLRIWRVYSIASPSSNFAVNEDPNTYPFSVKVDKQFSIEDIMNLNRDHYEGTDFDMTKGILAGPFGNPNYEMAHGLPKGQGPRSISIMRTSYCEISTSGPDFPKVWFATDAPATSVFVPFYSAALQSGGQFSPAYGTQEGPDLHRFNRSTAFWAFDFVANWMGLNYQNMSQEMVYPARDKLQQWVFDQVAAGEKKAKESPENAGTILGQLQTSIQQNVTDTWWKLADDLIVRYNDGYFNFGPYRPNAIGGIAFPTWFLRMIGYDDTFYRPGDHWVRPAGKDALEAAMANNTLAVTPINNVSTSSHGSWVGLLVGLAATVVVFGGGVVLGSRRERDRSLLKAEKDGYVRF